MVATELRVGNLIHGKGGYTYVVLIIDGVKNTVTVGDPNIFTINYDLKAEYVEPIPLTEEEFTKLGFRSLGSEWIKNSQCFQMFHDGLHYTGGEGVMYGIPIEYVHQLQNLYYDLTGEELSYE